MKSIVHALTVLALLLISTPAVHAADKPAPAADDVNEMQRVGRIFSDILHLAGSALEAVGSGLKWTGEKAKNTADGAEKKVVKAEKKAEKEAEKAAAKAN